MKIANRPVILRLLALVALVISAVFLADGWLPGSRLCSFESDCDLVVHSWLGKPFGIPLPFAGVTAFTGLFALSLAGGVRIRRIFRPLALVAGLGGAALILAQLFVIRHVCPFCMVVDGLAVLLALIAVFERGDPFPDVEPQGRTVWLVAALVGLAGGVFLVTVDGRAGNVRVGPVPPQVEALWLADKVNVVEIYDFQCPHCRKMYPVLREVLAEQSERIHHVRVTVPMPAHPRARYASRAYLCAEQQHKGAEMADWLIAMRRYSPEACEQLAGSLGLSLSAYRTCLADRALDRRLDADLLWVKEACPEGLPVIWIQNQRFSGVHSTETLRAAVQRAIQRLHKPDSENKIVWRR
jgi:uncharacterized membrane protein/protein-disulfide isomerase